MNKWAELIACHVRKTSASRTRRDMFRFGFSKKTPVVERRTGIDRSETDEN